MGAGHAALRPCNAIPGEPYRLELELALDSAEGRSVHPVELSEREASFLLEAQGTTAVELDPRHRLLTWTSDYGPMPGN